MRHLIDVLFAMAFPGVAILCIVRPVVVLRWAKKAHPDIVEDDKAILWVARLIGLAGLGVVVFFCVIIFQSF